GNQIQNGGLLWRANSDLTGTTSKTLVVARFASEDGPRKRKYGSLRSPHFLTSPPQQTPGRRTRLMNIINNISKLVINLFKREHYLDVNVIANVRCNNCRFIGTVMLKDSSPNYDKITNTISHLECPNCGMKEASTPERSYFNDEESTNSNNP